MPRELVALTLPDFGGLDAARLLPHASPWTFVDRVLACDPPRSIHTEKLVSRDDPFARAHFRGQPPVWPGVLLIEYVSQSAYLLARCGGAEQGPDEPVLLLGRCSASFVSPAVAGDLLQAKVTLLDRVGKVTVFEGRVSCGERVVCRVKLFASPPRSEPLQS